MSWNKYDSQTFARNFKALWNSPQAVYDLDIKSETGSFI